MSRRISTSLRAINRFVKSAGTVAMPGASFDGTPIKLEPPPPEEDPNAGAMAQQQADAQIEQAEVIAQTEATQKDVQHQIEMHQKDTEHQQELAQKDLEMQAKEQETQMVQEQAKRTQQEADQARRQAEQATQKAQKELMKAQETQVKAQQDAQNAKLEAQMQQAQVQQQAQADIQSQQIQSEQQAQQAQIQADAQAQQSQMAAEAQTQKTQLDTQAQMQRQQVEQAAQQQAQAQEQAQAAQMAQPGGTGGGIMGNRLRESVGGAGLGPKTAGAGTPAHIEQALSDPANKGQRMLIPRDRRDVDKLRQEYDQREFARQRQERDFQRGVDTGLIGEHLTDTTSPAANAWNVGRNLMTRYPASNLPGLALWRTKFWGNPAKALGTAGKASNPLGWMTWAGQAGMDSHANRAESEAVARSYWGDYGGPVTSLRNRPEGFGAKPNQSPFSPDKARDVRVGEAVNTSLRGGNKPSVSLIPRAGTAVPSSMSQPSPPAYKPKTDPGPLRKAGNTAGPQSMSSASPTDFTLYKAPANPGLGMDWGSDWMNKAWKMIGLPITIAGLNKQKQNVTPPGIVGNRQTYAELNSPAGAGMGMPQFRPQGNQWLNLLMGGGSLQDLANYAAFNPGFFGDLRQLAGQYV